MILTALRPVNARIGIPSINAPNPRYLAVGEKIKIKSRVLGDSVSGNTEWVLTDDNEFFSIEGFQQTDELKSIPYYAHLKNKPVLFQKLEVERLWDFSKSRGERINIGIIDSGVANHPALRGKVKELNEKLDPCKDMDSHGTNMACVIAALDEPNGVYGISPMVNNIYSYQIKIDENKCHIESNDLLEALEAMDRVNVQIINMSFTCQNASFFPKNMGGRQVQEKINFLANKGCIIVCATGNRIARKPIVFPASYENVISITGHLESEDLLYSKSGYWNGVSVSNIIDYYLDKYQFSKSCGTSSAAAIISGILACSYNLLEFPKVSYVLKMFKKLPIIKDKGGKTSVPKFDTNRFIQLLNI